MVQALEYEVERSLTDFEVIGLDSAFNLADGHAYQDLCDEYRKIIDDLPVIWDTCAKSSIPELEYRFCRAFALLADCPEMAGMPFKICPTASNSIEIIGSVLAHKGLGTRLVEPIFDNLALILQRRGVKLDSLSENDLVWAASEGDITKLLDVNPCDALFLVQPNNPTGRSLNALSFRAVAEYCAARRKILIFDNTFRFYNRDGFNDFSILRESEVSFLAFEDTGKVWPTNDLKASLLFSSPDLEQVVTQIYNEVYLCHSPFALAFLERFLLKTADAGLSQTIWAQVDERRSLLRRAIEDTNIIVDPTSVDSKISVEWLNCSGTGLRDFDLVKELATRGLTVLPGRQFFWRSSTQDERQFNVRLALMKPFENFQKAVDLFRSTLILI